MELLEKLKVLSDAAKYDVSCSSSGSKRKNIAGGVGNAAQSGICHSWSDDGRCISLLKILLTNYCVFDCAYCVNRASNDLPRAAFTPEEVVDLTINFYRRNYIEGLFLSSAIWNNPNHTMELLLQTVRKLRLEERFNGYIHLKAIPGADWRLIAEAGSLVDRMSVNIELPSNESLKLLAPQKRKETILKPMGLIGSHILESREERKRSRKAPSFVPAGQSTQLIIGATPDTDLKIINLSENLYHNFNLKRVYYSAYVPVSNKPVLPQLATPPLKRENRLYQADWLLRFYGFKAQELLSEDQPNFQLDLDPKSDWALRNLHLFPVEINKADYQLIIRVPGIGVKNAKKIIAARRFHSLSFEDLRKMGVVLKRARYFIICKGKYYGEVPFKAETIKNRLIPSNKETFTQLALFTEQNVGYQLADVQGCITGEL
ncbi:putative DNA modification/repair radical SAM protein [Desulfotomaculum defluvii]